LLLRFSQLTPLRAKFAQKNAEHDFIIACVAPDQAILTYITFFNSITRQQHCLSQDLKKFCGEVLNL
jgi:hypothetical protein